MKTVKDLIVYLQTKKPDQEIAIWYDGMKKHLYCGFIENDWPEDKGVLFFTEDEFSLKEQEFTTYIDT